MDSINWDEAFPAYQGLKFYDSISARITFGLTIFGTIVAWLMQNMSIFARTESS